MPSVEQGGAACHADSFWEEVLLLTHPWGRGIPSTSQHGETWRQHRRKAATPRHGAVRRASVAFMMLEDGQVFGEHFRDLLELGVLASGCGGRQIQTADTGATEPR